MNSYPHVVLVTGTGTKERFSNYIPEFSKINGQLTIVTLNEDENLRNMRNYQKIIKVMLDRKVAAGSVVLGIGDHEIVNLAGFVAATYLGGVDFIPVPTSLYGQITTLTSGRFYLNFSSRRNAISAWLLPVESYADLDLIKMNGTEEIAEGLIEAIRLGTFADTSTITLLEHIEDSQAIRLPDNSVRIIEKCIRCKLNNSERGSARMETGNVLAEMFSDVDRGKHAPSRIRSLGLLLELYFGERYGVRTRELRDRLTKLFQSMEIKPLLLRDLGIDSVMRHFRSNYSGEHPLKILVPGSDGSLETVTMDEERFSGVLRSYVENFEFIPGQAFPEKRYYKQ
ncbi:MAG TPA: hypothetical protein VKU79_03770 [Thermoplasmataceae archaeon]|nr:hypothetical protein [Thermoplasmatales archaeon AK]HLH85965.1 hypothetical protein [Thermoplasmataceae archaeon]